MVPIKVPSKGKQKIDILYISDKSKRQVTFYKRKKGLLKKAQEIESLTGAGVLLILVNETGTITSYSSDRLQTIGEEAKSKIESIFLDHDQDNTDDRLADNLNSNLESKETEINSDGFEFGSLFSY